MKLTDPVLIPPTGWDRRRYIRAKRRLFADTMTDLMHATFVDSQQSIRCHRPWLYCIRTMRGRLNVVANELQKKREKHFISLLSLFSNCSSKFFHFFKKISSWTCAYFSCWKMKIIFGVNIISKSQYSAKFNRNCGIYSQLCFFHLLNCWQKPISNQTNNSSICSDRKPKKISYLKKSAE